MTRLSRATWEAYCVYSAPYDNVFKLLRKQYRAALEHLPELPMTHGSPDPRDRFVEHLMVFVIRGLVVRGDADELLERFYALASPSQRRHAIEFTGRLLEQSGRAAPVDPLHRLRALWIWRLEVASAAADRADHREEISAFGWWFRTLAFDSEWALKQLHAALDTVGAVGPVRFVVDRLAAIAPVDTVGALTALRAIARAEPDELRLSTSGAIDELASISVEMIRRLSFRSRA